MCGGGGRGGAEECRVGSGGAGCRREKRGLCLLCRDIKDVYVSIDEGVFTPLRPAAYLTVERRVMGK